MKLWYTQAFVRLLTQVGLLLVVLAGLGYWGLFLPLQTWSTTASETSRQTAEQALLRKRIAEKALLEALDETLRQGLANLGEQLQQYHNRQIYLRELNRITQASGLVLSNVKVSVKPEFVQLAFEVTGSFADTVDLCYRLETHAMPAQIAQCKMTGIRDLVRTQFQVHLRRFHDEA